ncbi:betaine/proline/choline family ABC transporter ATP-binding protein [Actinophytocola sp.]|uniref:quaternary amine ABC transporter ATP-binding protein n=1 Tax=Actinophytocola sp. TaxID=1872138 RepID=UPI002ED60E9D
MRDQETIIEVRGLTKVFGGVLAVNNVSFRVTRGELFVVMGLSGSGKSTLIRMINRLLEPTEGSIHVDGVDIARADRADLRRLRNQRIAMVFQHFALFPHRTVRENVAYGLKVRGVAARERLERADTALEQVGLGHRGDARPDELSGGMKQRVGLARALATDADVLLMDEPFSALDPLIRRQMQSLLLQLQDEFHKTILFVTHDLNEAMHVGDRIMIMKDGEMVQLGTGPEILSSPANDYVRDFVADVDRTRVLDAQAVMQPPLLTAGIDEDPRDVLARLGNVEANGAYVVDEENHILGVATDELLAKAATERRPDLRTSLVDDYGTVSPDTPLAEFCHRAGRFVVPLTVVDDQGRLLGVVPRATLLAAIANRPEVADHA